MMPRTMGWVLPALVDLRDYAVEDYVSRWQRFWANALTLVQQEVIWECHTVLDQGDTPHCVGFTGADFQNTWPVDSGASVVTATALYYECKRIDGEPAQENGSSIHSLMKALRQKRRIQLYAFTTSLATVKLWLLTQGAVLVGTHWCEGMMAPDSLGWVHPTGAALGGHAYSLIGYDPKTDTLTGMNHWGSAWGLNGRFKITGREFARLITRGAELAMAVELPAVCPDPVLSGQPLALALA